MTLAPDSESLREFNKCHAPGTGEFCSTESSAFRDWFGASRVVDSKGHPLVVYRGDRPDKDVFTGKEDKSVYLQGNVFFSSKASIGKFYTRHRTNRYITPESLGTTEGLYRVYLSLQNPLEVDAGGNEWIEIPTPREVRRKVGYDTIQIDDLATLARKLGYDGLIVRNVLDQAGDGDQYVAFYPNQIKSATGNRGTWSRRSRKITEYNRCHDPEDGKFASPIDTPCGEPGALLTHVPRNLPRVQDQFWSGEHAVYGQRRQGGDAWSGSDVSWAVYLPVPDTRGPMYWSRSITTKGDVIPDKDLTGKLLYHVTGALPAVLQSGKLIAFASGTGLGGGSNTSVSFTTDRKAALNILDVMVKAKEVVDATDAARTGHDAVAAVMGIIKNWAAQEMAALARRTYPPHSGEGPLDRVPMHLYNKYFEGLHVVEQGLGSLGAARLTGIVHHAAASAALDAFKLWLNYRESAGLGKNPILFTRAESLRGKQFGLLAVPTRNLPKQTMVNFGADKFQHEVEVHGDVPIKGAYYLTRRRR